MILYGLAGIGKTAIARSLADNARIKDAFRDGIAWLDGSCDPDAEIARLCQALQLARAPGERWVESWRRWAGASERRFLLIVDDAVSAEGLLSLIAGMGPQVVALITTQQGAEIRAEVERWLPADAIMEVGIHGLAPTEGRELVEMVVGRPLAAAEWEFVQEIGELVGWHPEALRLAAIESREAGWQGMLEELKAGRMPWIEIQRLVISQWARLHPEKQAWLAGLIESSPRAPFTTDEAAQIWHIEAPVAGRWLSNLERCGLVVKQGNAEMAISRWRIEPTA